jgi:hypothetical protein
MSLHLTGLELFFVLQDAFARGHQMLQTLFVLFVLYTCYPQSLQVRHRPTAAIHDLAVCP